MRAPARVVAEESCAEAVAVELEAAGASTVARLVRGRVADHEGLRHGDHGQLRAHRGRVLPLLPDQVELKNQL